MKSMKIGGVAKLSGVGLETIRFYERKRLLEVPESRPSGYRQYGSVHRPTAGLHSPGQGTRFHAG